jgi:hypothetical protein
VKAKLSEKVARIDGQKRLLAITLNGKPKAIILPYQQFLDWVASRPASYEPRRFRFDEWEKESAQRKDVSASIKNLFDIPSLTRKGQKPYKANALKKFREP